MSSYAKIDDQHRYQTKRRERRNADRSLQRLPELQKGGGYLNEVDLVKAVIASRLLDVKDGDDVFVVEIAQQLHLSQGSQTEHGVVEGGDFLDGNLLSRRLVNCRAVQVKSLLETGHASYT